MIDEYLDVLSINCSLEVTKHCAFSAVVVPDLLSSGPCYPNLRPTALPLHAPHSCSNAGLHGRVVSSTDRSCLNRVKRIVSILALQRRYEACLPSQSRITTEQLLGLHVPELLQV